MSTTRTIIRCDTWSCREEISVTQEISEQAMNQIALQLGWQVQHGAHRDYHHCTRHKESSP